AIYTIISDLHVGAFLNFMSLAVLVGAIFIGYRSIVRREGFAEAIPTIGIMIAVVGIALTYASFGSSYIQKASNFTDDVGQVVIGALAGEGCKNSDGQPAPGNPEPYDCVAQTMYHVLIYLPWANGEIGAIDVINDEAATGQRHYLAYRIFTQQAYNPTEVRRIDDPNVVPAQRATVAQEIRNTKQEDRLKMVRDDWGARFLPKDGVKEEGGDKDKFDITDKEKKWRPYDHVDTDYPEYWELFSGKRDSQRFIVAVMALIGSFSLGLVLIAVSTAYIVLQIMTIVLAMVAPVAFFIALIPNYGYRIFLKWLELLVGSFIKRLALVVFVGVLLAGLQLVFKVSAPWWMQMLAAVCIGMAGLAYRRQLSSWASYGMEGVGKITGIATGGLLGMKDGMTSLSSANKTFKATKGLPLRQRAGAAASAAYNVHQTGPHQVGSGQRVYNASQRQAIAAQPMSRRQRRKARRRSVQVGSSPRVSARQQAIGPVPDGAQTGMGPQRSSRRGGYTYQA
ncbi:MAG: hypothetical protein ACRDPW_09475, partial [Mycobacteriales bacterium]